MSMALCSNGSRRRCSGVRRARAEFRDGSLLMVCFYICVCMHLWLYIGWNENAHTACGIHEQLGIIICVCTLLCTTQTTLFCIFIVGMVQDGAMQCA